MEGNQQAIEEIGAPAIFRETVTQPVSCSFNECTAGHRWEPQVMVVPCTGCNGSTIVVLKHNCPFCNEPITKTTIRADFVPRGAGMVKRCQGEKVFGETLNIELERTQWREIEEARSVDFKEKLTEKGLEG